VTKSNKSKAHAKLTDDATGTGQNLDQVLHFGLIEQIKDICKTRSQQFSEYGLTQHDVLEEIKRILPQLTVELVKSLENQEQRMVNQQSST